MSVSGARLVNVRREGKMFERCPGSEVLWAQVRKSGGSVEQFWVVEILLVCPGCGQLSLFLYQSFGRDM